MKSFDQHTEQAPWLMIPDCLDEQSTWFTSIHLVWTAEEINRITNQAAEDTAGSITYTVISLAKAKLAPKLLTLAMKMFTELKYQYGKSNLAEGTIMDGFREEMEDIMHELSPVNEKV